MAISRPLYNLGKHLGRIPLLHHLLGHRRALVEILSWQAQPRIVQPPRVLIVAPAAGEEDADEGGQGGAHARRHWVLCALHGLHALAVALPAGLPLDGPVGVPIPGDTLPALKHVQLADEEAGDDERSVTPRAHRRTVVVHVLGELVQAQEGGDGARALLPRGQIDLGRPVVVERELLGAKVEAEPDGAHGQAVLVPQAADHRGPGAPGRLDLGEDALGVGAQRVFLDERFVAVVQAEDVGHDVRDPGPSGRLDDLGMDVRRHHGGEGDDEKLLTFQGGHEA